MTHPHSSSRDLLGLAAAAALLFFVSLGARDLWNPNEPIYGRAVVEMADHDDWLIPTVNEKVFAEKPILYFWGALAASKALGGVDELSLRVPSALAGVASVLLTYLLVLPYAGRRRALVTAALFATCYQVFWASRAVQMDILVLASTLGVVVPLTRMLDFGARPARACTLAGVAAGVGFVAKGPVALVLPGIVVFGYALSRRRLAIFRSRGFALGALVAIVTSAPWYLALWLSGETGFLYEVLIRQNFTRFVEAWDHVQPWWYYGKYLWIDYAPWSLLLPAAALARGGTEDARRLDRLCWIWVLGVIFFFSLSESKRAPYILPIAPAVAALAAGVVDRLIAGARQRRAERLATVAPFALLAVVFSAAGVLALLPPDDVPAAVGPVVTFLGSLMLLTGAALAVAVALSRRLPVLMPAALGGGMVVIYLAAAVWALPAADPLKSARGFTAEMNRELAVSGGRVASYRFWDWRAGYVYYADRTIPNLKEAAALEAYWRSPGRVFVLVERPHAAELRALLPDARLVLRGKIGSREALLFARPPATAKPAVAAFPG